MFGFGEKTVLGAVGKLKGSVVAFGRNESGAATADYIVITGLVAAVSAVLLLNVAGGSEQATMDMNASINNGIERELNIPGVPNSGSGHNGTSTYVAGNSSGGQGGVSTAIYEQPDRDEPDTSGGEQYADASGSFGGGGSEAPVSNSDSNGGSFGGGSSSSSSGSGSGGGFGGGSGEGSSSEGSAGGDDACGLGKGNASANGNANASAQAFTTPASNCPVDDSQDNGTTTGVGNPGNDKNVGNAGENPNGKGDWGSGSNGMSDGDKTNGNSNSNGKANGKNK